MIWFSVYPFLMLPVLGWISRINLQSLIELISFWGFALWHENVAAPENTFEYSILRFLCTGIVGWNKWSLIREETVWVFAIAMWTCWFGKLDEFTMYSIDISHLDAMVMLVSNAGGEVKWENKGEKARKKQLVSDDVSYGRCKVVCSRWYCRFLASPPRNNR